MKGIVKPSELEIIDRYIQSGDRVFDVGARSGTWSVAVLLAKPGVELHAFEPAPIGFRTLKQQLSNRWQGQVFLNNTALFNREDVQDAYSYEKKRARSIFHRWRKTKKTLRHLLALANVGLNKHGRRLLQGPQYRRH